MNLKMFQNSEFGEIRVVMQGEEPWFVASDISKILGYSQTFAMTRMLDESEISKIKSSEIEDLSNQFGNNDLTIINESGLYQAIFASRKPEAKRFRLWVTGEVLPSIRRTGGYLIAKPEESGEEIMARAILVAADTIKRLQSERDEAIRTKALIGSKREATAMATASAASRRAIEAEAEAYRLQVKLDERLDFKSIMAVEAKLHPQKFPWQPLKRWCDENGMEIRKVTAPENCAFSMVNTYPSAAWRAVYGIDIIGLFSGR
jgi:prophage antirepressor-like protein